MPASHSTLAASSLPFSLSSLSAAIALVGASVGGGAFAQPATPEVTLPRVVVTASRREQAERSAPASLTVITRKEIESQPASNVAELLRSVEGVSLVGANPNETDIAIRGMPGDYTLLLVDGQRQNTRETMNRGTGGVQAKLLPPLAAIERIEVVRGPMSALYGADAMGGVVNIITRKFSKDWRGAIEATAVRQTNDEIGNAHGVDFWFGGPIVADGLGLQLWGGSDKRGEDDFYVPANATSGANGQRNKRVNLKATVRIDERQDLSFALGAQRFNYLATPGLSIADTATPTTVVATRHTRENLGVTHDGRWDWGRSTVSVYQDTGTQAQTLAGGAASVEPEVTTTIAEGRAVVLWGDHVLSVGVQSSRQRLSGVATQDAVPAGLPANPSTIARNGYALFGENDFALTRAFTLTTGARLDHDENYGNHVSPRLYGVYTLNPQWTLRGGVGSGFRAPALRQSAEGYCMTTGGAAGATPGTLCGNPELKPETSVTGEFGARWDGKASSAGFTIFNNRFKNRVASYDTGVPDPRVAGRNIYVYDNIARVDIAGIELAASSTLARGVQVSGNYTLTDSKRKGGGENAFNGTSLDGKPLDKTPKHKANVRVEWQALPALAVFSALDYTGKQYWSAFRNGAVATREREATTTFDLGGRYTITRGVALKLALLNVTDERVDVDTRARTAGLNGNWLVDEGRRLSLTLSAEF